MRGKREPIADRFWPRVLTDTCPCGARLEVTSAVMPMTTHTEWLDVHEGCRKTFQTSWPTDFIHSVLPTTRIPLSEGPASMLPTIGRIVIYKSKIDNGEGNDVLSPAMVLRTKSTTVPAVIQQWGPEPQVVGVPPLTHETASRPESVINELPDDETVDLVVWGLGKTYREYAVAHGDERGQWQWPQRN